MRYYVKYKNKSSSHYQINYFKSKRTLCNHIKSYIINNNIKFSDSLEHTIIRRILIGDYHNFNVRQFNNVFKGTRLDYRVFRSFEDLSNNLLLE